jgi:hypothetical protein
MVDIPESTEDIIARSTFTRRGVYRWVSASRVGDASRHAIVMRDDREITVVTREEDLVDLEVVSENPDRWELLAIDCANPFYCVGFVARIASALTSAGIDILFTSTFTRDLVFVKESELARGAAALESLGMREVAPRTG